VYYIKPRPFVSGWGQSVNPRDFGSGSGPDAGRAPRRTEDWAEPYQNLKHMGSCRGTSLRKVLQETFHHLGIQNGLLARELPPLRPPPSGKSGRTDS
jgi:hypothetical protein